MRSLVIVEGDDAVKLALRKFNGGNIIDLCFGCTNNLIMSVTL